MDNKNFQSKTGFNLENTYLTLPNIFFSEQNPKGSKNPKLIKFNTSLAEELGLNEEILNSDFGLNILQEMKLSQELPQLHRLMPVTNLAILQC